MTSGLRKILLAASAALLFASSLALFAACTDDPAPHEHTVESWTVKTPATCTEYAVEEGVCTVCGETQTRSGTTLAPHDFEFVSTLKKPTCTEKGLDSVKCTVCGTESTQETDPAHTWRRTGINKQPTCDTDGEYAVKCEVCGTESTQVWEKLGHSWTDDGTGLEPTCTAPGSRNMSCSRCGAKDVQEIPALGHDWESDFTVDKKPTFDEAGSRSVHCKRCEDGRDRVTEISQLDANKETTYEIHLTRSNGDALSATGIGFEVYEGEEKVANGTFRNGIGIAILPARVYTVRLTNCPEGYTVQDGYTTSFDEFTTGGAIACETPISGELIETPATAQTKYSVGSVVHDFTYTDAVTGETLHLSDILNTKRGVILNFWYVNCTYCREEFPELQKLYGQYGEDIAIIAVNASARLMELGQMAAPDTKRMIQTFVREEGYTFNFVEDPAGGEALSWKFSVTGTPVSYFIDAEGVVCEIVDGYVEGSNEMRLKNAIEKMLSVSAQKPAEAMLPGKEL